MSSDALRRYRSATRRLTAGLLAAWAAVTFGSWPLGFWFAAQGALIGFVLVVVAYALAMERLERRFVSEAAAEAQARKASS